jgi:hypothetical protein
VQRDFVKYIPVVALVVSGLIHLLPVPGVTGAAALTRLYGIEVADPNTSILLQHRAVLFGVLGILMLVAAAVPSLRVTVLTVSLMSAASFVVVAIWVGGYNSAIARVVAADTLATILLASGLVAELWLARQRTGL